MSDSTIAQNRRARHDYEILERFEAGIVLTGSEIKSVREHKVQLQGSYARLRDGEVWLEDAHIAPYANAGYAPHNPTRDRKLLLHRKEIAKIAEALGERGLTLIPLAMYFKRGKAKVELGVARGLKRYDKREKVKEREEQRRIEQAVRQRA
ncbi:MAG TPA: SsrA-binding protein SmpB [Tepidiformaceae bacterium]|nr:SsrA-binding protein SmpB [Tepidiformaceae bacterium]